MHCIDSICIYGTKAEILELIPSLYERFIGRFDVLHISPFLSTDDPNVFSVHIYLFVFGENK